MYVVGTAGHVDHGKSALVQALSGIDPDRLQEEKDRGMTIDLGFAWLELPGGTEISIVDVPGHERFIKNMLAGVGGIDLALLVIAADEGVMPQTREHLAILDLLGVHRGILVITKSDLVDEDWLGLVSAEVEEAVEGTTLEGSPLVTCSAITRDGLDALLALIEMRLVETAPKRDLGRPRLPIDRVFTISGHGTIVTGTLIDGSLRPGQDVEIVPAITGGHVDTLRTRIRGVQTHRSRVEEALPGTRTAANLANVEPEQLWRGQVVTTPGWLQPSVAVDVRLRALESLSRPLRHNLHLTFHSLASEAPARLRLLELDELVPGGETWAQVRLYKPLALLKGDRFIIRDANDTLGGGTIVETQARRHPRLRESVIAALERQLTGDPAEAIYAAIAAAEPAPLRTAIDRTGLGADEAAGAIGRLLADGRIVVIGDSDARHAYTSTGFERLRAAAIAAVEAHIKEHPLRRGLSREELRSRLNLPQRLFGPVLAAIVARDNLSEAGSLVAPAGWQPALTPQQRADADAYLDLLRTNPFMPPADRRPSDDIIAYLEDDGAIVECGNDTVFTAEAFEEMTRRVVELARERGAITMGEVRDLLGSSRRYVQPFLEELDNRRVTIRRGDERVLR